MEKFDSLFKYLDISESTSWQCIKTITCEYMGKCARIFACLLDFYSSFAVFMYPVKFRKLCVAFLTGIGGGLQRNFHIRFLVSQIDMRGFP